MLIYGQIESCLHFTMSILERATEGKLRLECSEICLERAGSTPIQIKGPGSIESNDRGLFDYRFHISSVDHDRLRLNLFGGARRAGSLVPADEFLTLTAISYSDGEWTGRVSNPGTDGPVGGPGIATGEVYELTSTRKTGASESDYVKFYLPGRLAFPTIISTKREQSRAGEIVTVTGTRDAAEFETGGEKTLICRAGDHTEIECTLRRGGIEKNQHLRLVEALTFALGQPILPGAIEIVSGGNRTEILRVTDPPSSRGHSFNAPLQFGYDNPVREVYDIAASYYKRVVGWEAQEEHPVSSGVFSVVQAARDSIEIQVLGLSIAAESLIESAFKEIVPVEAGLEEEIARFKDELKKISLRDSVKNRIRGRVEQMLTTRNSDRILAFVEKYALGEEIFDAWRKLRNRSAHGGQINYGEMEKVWDRRNKVLHLCHSIVLAFIGYSGIRTNHGVPGLPTEKFEARTDDSMRTRGN
jgi:hypothetical protein